MKLDNVSKVYKLYSKSTDRLRETINPFRKKYHIDFFALKDIAFSIGKGETFGIIGSNGSGKSTILKIMTGILTPTSGRVTTSGRISALLELGAGFNPEYTGLENIYLNGTIMGFSKDEMDARMEQIIQFADIGNFIHQPVKTYSSGMFVRLAFAVAINVDPDILIIDEALSVGDVRFQQKCYRKIEDFRLAGKTVVFVSHDLATVVKFCDRVIWINNGEIQDEGDPLEVSKKFQAFMMGSELTKYENKVKVEAVENSATEEVPVPPLDGSLDMHGDSKAAITGIGLIDFLSQKSTKMVSAGQKVTLSIAVKFFEDVPSPIVGFSVKDKLGNIVTQTNSYVLNTSIDDVEFGTEAVVHFTFMLPSLNDGNYLISPAVASGTQVEHVQHCWVHDALVIEIVNSQMYRLPGFLFLDTVKCNFSVWGFCSQGAEHSF